MRTNELFDGIIDGTYKLGDLYAFVREATAQQQAEIADLKIRLDVACQLGAKFEDLNTGLKAEIASLREDKARLDWIESHKDYMLDYLHDRDEGPWLYTDGDNFHQSTTARQAIDQARRGQT